MLAAVSLISGCTLVDDVDVETSAIEQFGAKYKKLFHQRDYTKYRVDFLADKNQLILADMENVDVIDLETGTRIMHMEISNSRINSLHVSKDQTKLFLFTSHITQIWDTKNWRLLKELKAGRYHNELAGFSSDETLLFFGSALWFGQSFEKIHEFGIRAALNGYAFSPDNRYFVDSDHHFGISVSDIENRKWTEIHYFSDYSEKGASQVSFRDNDSFFAGYGAQIDLRRSGYFSSALGIFSAKEEHQIESFRPAEKITCWIHDPDYGVLVSLYNGDIYLLDDRLDIQFKWHMNDFARSCVSARPGEIWLGGDKTGVYRADLASKRMSHEYVAGNPIYSLKVSSDGRYLGFVESPPGESKVTVLTPVPNQIERR
jgi:WD40 repeat protein